MPLIPSGLGTPLFLRLAYLEQMAVGVVEKTADLVAPVVRWGQELRTA